MCPHQQLPWWPVKSLGTGKRMHLALGRFHLLREGSQGCLWTPRKGGNTRESARVENSAVLISGQKGLVPGSVGCFCINTCRLFNRSSLASATAVRRPGGQLPGIRPGAPEAKELSLLLPVLPLELGSHSYHAGVSSSSTGAHMDMSGLSCKMLCFLWAAGKSPCPLAHSGGSGKSC